jgi:hypothetical protein
MIRIGLNPTAIITESAAIQQQEQQQQFDSIQKYSRDLRHMSNLPVYENLSPN